MVFLRRNAKMGFLGGAIVLIAGLWSRGSDPLLRAYAEDSQSPSTNLSGRITDPRVGTQLPPIFDPSIAQSMSAALMSCMNISPQFNQIASALMGNGTSSPDGTCGSDSVPEGLLSARCDDFSDLGKFSPELLKRRLEQLDKVSAAVSCKRSQVEAVHNQVTCLMHQSSTLEAQVQNLQKAFAENIQRMQQDVALIKNVEKDRELQQVEVQKKLKGDEESGRPGLIQMKDTITKLVNEQMPQEILQVKEDLNDLNKSRKALDEQVEQRKMFLTNDCFSNRVDPGLHCEQNDSGVSAKAHALCLVYKGAHLKQNKRNEAQITHESKGSLVTQQAKAIHDRLESILSRIGSDSPQPMTADPNKDPTKAAEQASRPVSIYSLSDIDKQLGPSLDAIDRELKKVNGVGSPLRAWVKGRLQSCYSRAGKVVSEERKRKSSALGSTEEGFKKQERTLLTRIDQLTEGYSQHMRESLAVLSGQHLPPNTAACKHPNPATRITCLDDLQKNLTGILNGNVPQSSMDVRIQGTDPATTLQLRCQGLSGCVTILQNVNTNLTRERKRLMEFKNDYVLKANQNVQNFAQQMAQVLSPQSQMLQERLKNMNAMLAKLGVSPINIEPMEGEEIEKDEDGLPKVPKNVLAFVGSKMSPRMLNLSGNAFSEGLQGISEAAKEIAARGNDVESAKQMLTSLEPSCRRETLFSNYEKLNADVEKLDSCFTSVEFCTEQNVSRLSDLVSTMGGVVSDAPLGVQVGNLDDMLRSGADTCARIQAKPPEEKKAISDSQLGTRTGPSAGSCEALVRRIGTKAERMERLTSDDGGLSSDIAQ